MDLQEIKELLSSNGYKVETYDYLQINGVNFNHSSYYNVLNVVKTYLLSLDYNEKQIINAIKFPEIKTTLTIKNFLKRITETFEALKSFNIAMESIKAKRIDENSKLQKKLQRFKDNGFNIQLGYNSFNVETMNLQDKYYEFDIINNLMRFKYYITYKISRFEIANCNAKDLETVLKLMNFVYSQAE